MSINDRISLQHVQLVLIDLNQIVSPMQATCCVVQVAIPVLVSVFLKLDCWFQFYETRLLVSVLVSVFAETRMPLLVWFRLWPISLKLVSVGL